MQRQIAPHCSSSRPRLRSAPNACGRGNRPVRRLDPLRRGPEARARDGGALDRRRLLGSVLCHYELASDHLKHTKGYDPRVWGTPAQCIEKILDIRTRLGCETFVGVLSYAGMPWEDPERNVHPFAPEVRPALPALDDEARADVPTPAEAAARQD